ncbi:uncharacterized protein N7529_008212 [Penicillium soppii]|jgi:hypothetical protein|uniref:uncharacterized protein n=1 Tax=Penicillium soppii TaxID=69789 RepID=UPI0025484B99|nr:uncharacterized protein N7529_008212 [Penicillium soppii]KAJ5860902.1 hypothetical protein N7529_008212 [Penicillium soppii]
MEEADTHDYPSCTVKQASVSSKSQNGSGNGNGKHEVEAYGLGPRDNEVDHEAMGGLSLQGDEPQTISSAEENPEEVRSLASASDHDK